MAKTIGRAKPYTGETVRRYEEGIDEPGEDARKALSLVFGKSEAFILFGDEREPSDKLLAQLIDLYGSLSEDGRDRLLGAANRIHVDEHPGRSAANPFPGASHEPVKPKRRGK